jgi:hypothetical protein
MNVFSKPFNQITFEDVVEFCKQKHSESTTLDYKKELPRDLDKHFATFSNTLGGVIIIGVEEDSSSGVPLKWEGVANDSKLIERVNQFAANVNPLPSYDVRLTDEKNKKVFLLISILEGDAPPYLANSEPTVWLRTGNISKPLRQAEREELVRMVEKKNSAEPIRQQNIKIAESVFSAGLKRAEIERKKLIDDAQKAGNSHMLSTTPYDIDNSFLTVSLQPFYPKRLLVEPREIKSKIGELQTKSRFGMDFPPYDMEPIPNGLFCLKQLSTGNQIRGYQLYGTGLIHYTEDIWWRNEHTDKSIHIAHIAHALCRQLIFARKFYAMFGYSGLVVGEMKLQNAIGASVYLIVPDGYTNWSFNTHKLEKLSDYSWEIDTDTHVLNDEELLKQLFKKKMQEVYWSLGIEEVQDEILEAYLKESAWH